MKVLFVSRGNNYNGISPIVRNQGESLINQGIKLEFFLIRGKGFSAYFRNVFILRRKLKKSSFDIIHAHYGLCGIVALFAKRSEKIVVSYMGDDLLGSRREDGTPLLFTKLMARINDFLSGKYFNYSIVKSRELFLKLRKRENVSIISNGVNFDLIYRVPLSDSLLNTGFSADELNILFISDPKRPEKNFSLAKEAVGNLDNNKIRLHVLNDISREKLKYFYSAANLLLMTSYHEGSPNVVKEAMACCLPVICTDVGDVRELFGETEGYYITSFDSYEISEKIRKVLQKYPTGELTRGRERILELGLDSESIAKRIIVAYNKLLANKY